MLYWLFQYLEDLFAPPGFQVFQFITVRASLAAITALVISTIIGRRIIRWLAAQQIGEEVRQDVDAGAVDHSHKRGTPTMGGVIILFGVLGSTLLWGAIWEPWVWLAMLATAWMGAFGFADDYIKVVKRDKSGLPARIKLIGQISLGLLVGTVIYVQPAFEEFNTLTYLPFVAEESLDYNFLAGWIPGVDLGWLIYIPVTVFIVTALSNAVNLTDGLDGLAAGVTGIVALGLTALCYVAGNVNIAEFLSEMYLVGAGELTVFTLALAAACFGFLWYNGYPAQVFMGDTGALALGAAVGTVTLLIRKELLLPLLCAVFLAESLSVIIQTTWFKYTRRKYGEGRRVFLMAPFHHHWEAKGLHEAKIVVRFWIVTAVTVVAALLILRIR
ncbi:MAG: phospho-N-acetylmuramoyl-pentapeptide-transferase [Rhodothermales bacterium]|nr:phospho-N-acetylmuramoyl-pentapeptide-transferase [Rhodothermales bacterium]MBO6778877.1 phospho-N-acetylmuramoyl-pentapeptide-transferase [Rhodothermales bacterium]